MRYYYVQVDGIHPPRMSKVYHHWAPRDRAARKIAEEQAYSEETEDTIYLLDVPDKEPPTLFALNP